VQLISPKQGRPAGDSTAANSRRPEAMAATITSIREETLRIGPVRLHFVEWGDPRNPTLLLVHGRSANAMSWLRFAEAMADRYRIVAYDQRGHGLSDWTGRYTWKVLLADLSRVIQHLGLRRFGLVGHSMGARIAWSYAARHPELPACLILLDASPTRPGQEDDATSPWEGLPGSFPFPSDFAKATLAKGWAEGADRVDRDLWVTRYARRMGHDRFTWGFDREAYMQSDAALRWPSARADWRDVRRIGWPTLVAIGKDGQLGESNGAFLVSQLRAGSLAVVARSGHMPHWSNNADLVAEVVPFLAAHL
jgi:pimeloyl-ACP methyl ester carboxylesterase